ncbi:M48 family metallopeptidase [Thermodesulfobacteriota bacterium]
MRIVVNPDLSVNVYTPKNASDRFIHESVIKKAPWILRSIKKLEKCRVLSSPEKYISGEKIAYLGEEYLLKIINGKRRPSELLENNLVVSVTNPDTKSVKKAVNRWYRARAGEIFGKYLQKRLSIASQYGITRPFMNIRLMKSRWGTCRSSGKITLNLRLIQLPEICIEYIVMHELCHLKHPNHSKHYYSFLSLCMPEWKAHKRLLDSIILTY